LSQRRVLKSARSKNKRVTRGGNGNGTQASQKFWNCRDRLGLRARSCTGRGHNLASDRSVATSHSAQTEARRAPPSSGGGRLTPGPSNVVGWNFKVCNQSYLARAPSGRFLLFAENSDGSFFVESSTSQILSFFQNQLLAACQHAGGGYWVHVDNPEGNLFDAIDIYYP
jgi:hypothetical protein